MQIKETTNILVWITCHWSQINYIYDALWVLKIFLETFKRENLDLSEYIYCRIGFSVVQTKHNLRTELEVLNPVRGIYFTRRSTWYRALEALLIGAIRLSKGGSYISYYSSTFDHVWKHLLQLRLSVALWKLSHTARRPRERSMMVGVISLQSKNQVPGAWEAQQSAHPPCLIKREQHSSVSALGSSSSSRLLPDCWCLTVCLTPAVCWPLCRILHFSHVCVGVCGNRTQRGVKFSWDKGGGWFLTEQLSSSPGIHKQTGEK